MFFQDEFATPEKTWRVLFGNGEKGAVIESQYYQIAKVGDNGNFSGMYPEYFFFNMKSGNDHPDLDDFVGTINATNILGVIEQK